LKAITTFHLSLFTFYALLIPLCLMVFLTVPARAEEKVLRLQDLIDEALKSSPELQASESRVAASAYRIPQEKSLPDPMFMFGYQNDGFNKYSYGESLMSQWMFSLSQTFPFPGKLPLKGEIARRDSEGLGASHEDLRLKTIEKVKQLYYDLFLAYKDIDLVKDMTALFSRIEDAALARYSTGIGQQQEVLMAQTEKYMLLEKEEMFRQKIESAEAMLNSTIGRDVNSPLGRPLELQYEAYGRSLDELVRTAYENSPEVRAKQKMIGAAEAGVRLAEKGYYPDFTLNGSVAVKGGPYMDMWSLTAAVNIPIFYRTKQRQAVLEAKASLSGARKDLEATKLTIASAIRNDYSTGRTAERLMTLYRDGLIPKATQDFEAALAGYNTGKVDAVTVITTLKSLIDSELLYWGQFVEREKALARIEATTGGVLTAAVQGEKR
jgi:cobalt-zinc-cadmium efflux system outer membrane protein